MRQSTKKKMAGHGTAIHRLSLLGMVVVCGMLVWMATNVWYGYLLTHRATDTTSAIPPVDEVIPEDAVPGTENPVSATVATPPASVVAIPASPSGSIVTQRPSTSAQVVLPPVHTPPQHTQPSTVTLDRLVGLSVAETLSVASEDEIAKRLGDLVSMGVGWIRIDLAWSSIQPNGPDEYHWTAFDRVVRAARARNINVLAIIAYTPRWARKDVCAYTSKCEPRDPTEYAMFAQKAVERYAPQGVHAWELWNEPNIHKFWAPGASVAGYATLVKATYPVIKRVDPSATVVLGGLAPATTGDGNIAPRNFLEELYGNHALQGYFDAVGWHPYTYPVRPSDYNRSSAWSQMSETEWNVRSVMRDHGDSGKKVWMTEFGAPTGGPGKTATEAGDASMWSWPDHVTEAYQAELLTEAFTTARAYSWAGPFFWYSYKDLGTNTGDVEHFFGIIRADGSRKPAYDALTKVTR